MISKLRSYLTPMILMASVALLGASAFAVSTQTPLLDDSVDQADQVEQADLAEPALELVEEELSALESAGDPDDVAGAEEELADEAGLEKGSDGINHGHCVSYAAHRAKDDEGLEPGQRGKVISAVAQNQEAEATKEGGCPAAYESAVAELQGSEGTPTGQLNVAEAAREHKAEKASDSGSRQGPPEGRGPGQPHDRGAE